jgi:hypothetical protein
VRGARALPETLRREQHVDPEAGYNLLRGILEEFDENFTRIGWKMHVFLIVDIRKSESKIPVAIL